MDNQLIFEDARIFIVDDEPSNIELLDRILRRAGYRQICGVSRPKMAVQMFQEFQPDIVLLDLHMPGISGLELMQMISPLVPSTVFLPIVVLTADITSQAKREALLLGAHDYLTKPWDRVEILLRIRNHLRTRFLSVEVQNHSDALERKIRERTVQLELAQNAIIESLAKASEYRDDNTGEHTKRVGQLSAKLARALGFDERQASMMEQAASLHDVGKIGIPDNILLKPGKLTPDEFHVMKHHTTIGKDIISHTHLPLLDLTQKITYTHHERWDGTGYPRGLSGDDIPVEGQIVSIVDVYDALMHNRPYKEAWTPERALLEITNQSGKQFNPKIVKAFLQVLIDIEDTDQPDKALVGEVGN